MDSHSLLRNSLRDADDRKKRLRNNCKQGKGNIRGRTHAAIDQEVTTLTGESTLELMFREMHSQQALLVLTGHDPT